MAKKGTGGKPDFLFKEVQRCNRNLLVTNTGVVILGVLWATTLYLADLSWQWYLGWIAAIIAIPVWNFYKLYRRYEDPKMHPLFNQFTSLGDISEVSEVIEEDLTDNPIEESRWGSFIITPRWLITRTLFNFTAVHTTQFLWIYILQTKHSVNFIPTGSTYSIQILTLSGNFEVSVPQAHAERLLGLLHSIAPWAIFGYSDELKDAWDKNPQAIIGEVRQRFEEVTKKHAKHR